MSKYHDAVRLGKRGELFVFTHLLQRGIVPYAPLLDIEAVDCVVRKPGGGYLEIQVKTNNTPKTLLWWNTPVVPKTDDYILVFVSVPRNWDVWILTGKEFYKHVPSDRTASGMISLDLQAKNREKNVELFRSNWDIILNQAQIQPIETTTTTTTAIT